MSLESRPLPGLFGGVSQQIPALRHPTQCSEQDNGLATLVDGLYKRPGARHVAALALTSGGMSVQGSYGAAFGHVITDGSASRYQVVIVDGSLMVFDLATGAAQAVSTPTGTAYLDSSNPAEDFRAITVADYTFIVNKSVTCAMAAATSGLNPLNVAYVNVRTAVANTPYSITVDNITSTITSSNTPTNAAIALALRNQVAADHINLDSVVVMPNTNCIRITKTGGALVSVSVQVSDGWSNTAMEEVSRGVDTFSDLPPAFETGFVVKVNGSAEKASDPYYVKWDGGRWVETFEPGAVEVIDKATMPHQLRPNGSGGWVFEACPSWEARKVGDNNTNPLPSFIGRTIRNVLFHRNRLGFLAGDSIVLSRAGAYFAFFATTATQVLDTDPIDLAATEAGVNTLDWTVVYNQTLLIFSSGPQQFVLAAEQVLSPATARLMPATTFESFNGAAPAGLGNWVLFPTNTGTGCQLNLYRVSEDTVTNKAEDVTEHAPSYVPSSPRKLAASPTFKAVAVVPSGASKTIKVFKYETDGEELQQKAWQSITFSTPDAVQLIDAHWDSRKLYVLAHCTTTGDAVAGGRFHLWCLDFDRTATDLDAGVSLALDQKWQTTASAFDGTSCYVDVPYRATDSLVYLKCTPGLEPVLLTPTTTSLSAVSTRAYFGTNLGGATVWAGRRMPFRYVFSEPFLRDREGQPLMAAVTKAVRLLLRYVSTGDFKALVANRLRATYTYPFVGRTVGQPGQGATQLALSTGDFAVPIGAKADAVEVVVESDSHLPLNLPYAEWVLDVSMKARR